MAVFIEKSPVTSSNCYKTIKSASVLIKLGTNVDWTIAFVTTCMLSFEFPVTMATRGRLKIAKNHYFSLFFPSKLISKCFIFLMD
jgi:hypothetical protein